MNPSTHGGSWLAWLKNRSVNPGPPAKFWLGKFSVPVAWIGLLVAAFAPPHGAGIPVCWFEDATGIPCPGCGMTRSLSCAVRGMFAESFHYHPFGIFILGLFAFTAIHSLSPRSIQEQIARFMQRHTRWFNGAYLAFVITFVGFGLARALSHLAHDGLPIMR